MLRFSVLNEKQPVSSWQLALYSRAGPAALRIDITVNGKPA